ncbi:MAG: site-2 protease family protein, partial [Clostridia bacterium]|nr:site-2 protease family protein [Clostridia bacterium]
MEIFIKVLQVLLSILLFGFLIFIHEGGHFLFARLFKVTVNEFAIGMGPKLLSKKSKKSGIVYSLRAFPIGGFVSMAGEDEDSDDPNAFFRKPVWQRLIITAAGATVNLAAGAIVMTILVLVNPILGSTTIAEFNEGAISQKAGLEVMDEIKEIDGHNVHILDDLYYEVMRLGIEPVDITVIRDGKEIVVKDVEFPQQSASSIAFGDLDFKVARESVNPLTLAKHSYYKCTYTVKMIWESFYDLITGRYGIEAVSGPVGVTEALTEAADAGAYSFTNLAVIISINLGVMN